MAGTSLQQQAYGKIDQMTDDGVKVFLDLFEKMQRFSVSGLKDRDTDEGQAVEAPNSLEEGDEARVDRKLDVEEKKDILADALLSSDMDTADFFEILDADSFSSLSKAEKKKFFLQSRGKIDIDEEAIISLRERSIM